MMADAATQASIGWLPVAAARLSGVPRGTNSLWSVVDLCFSLKCLGVYLVTANSLCYKARDGGVLMMCDMLWYIFSLERSRPKCIHHISFVSEGNSTASVRGDFYFSKPTEAWCLLQTTIPAGTHPVWRHSPVNSPDRNPRVGLPSCLLARVSS